MRWLLVPLALLGGPAAAAPWPAAAANADFLPVEQAFPIHLEWREQGVLVSFATAPGYALYKQRLRLDYSPRQWRVGEWQVAGQLEADDDAEPEFRDRYTGPLAVYIPLARLQKDGPDPVLTFQGCSLRGLCYPPQRAILRRP